MFNYDPFVDKSTPEYKASLILKQKQKAINTTKFGVFLLAFAVAYYAIPLHLIPDQLNEALFKFSQVTVLYFALEVVRAITILTTVQIEKQSSGFRYKVILGASIAISVIIGVSLGFHVADMYVGEMWTSKFWAAMAGVQAANAMVFFIELSLSYLFSGDGQKYDDLVTDKAAIQNDLTQKALELEESSNQVDALSLQVDAFSSQIAVFSPHIATFAGVVNGYENIINTTVKYIEMLEEVNRIHQVNLKTFGKYSFTASIPGSRNKTIVELHSCGTYNVMTSNNAKTYTCCGCQKVVNRDPEGHQQPDNVEL